MRTAVNTCGRAFCLVGFHSHFVACHFLVEFLSQDRNHIECRATGQCCGNEFDWFRPRASGRVVEQHVVLAASRRGELPLCLKWLSKHNFSSDHLCLSQAP